MVAFLDDKEVGRVSSNLNFAAPSRPALDQPGPSGTVVIKPPSLENDRVVKVMPSAIADVAVGGMGRYLILHFPQLRKLGIFDVTETKLVGYIPVGDDNVRFAAGMDKLVVLLPDQQILQRWDLTSRTRELAVPLQTRFKIQQVAMGSGSQGPIMIVASNGPIGADTLFVSLKTLKPLPLELTGDRTIHDNSSPLRASADGRVFSGWSTHGSPQSLETLVVEGGKVRVSANRPSAGHAIPSADGRFLLTGRGLYSQQCKSIGKEDRNNPYLLPAVQGPYCLALDLNQKGPGSQRHPVAIHLPGLARPLVTLTGLELPEGMNAWDREKFQTDRRIHFIPDAKLLLTLPTSNDKLILHRLDVEQLVEKSDTDYLFITSQPPESVRKRQTFRYQLQVKSRKGGVSYKLDAAPAGMEVTEGLIRWTVPADYAEAETTVIVCVSDKSGQEVFQTFKVTIEP